MNKTQIFVANVNALIDSGEITVSEIARRASIDRSQLSALLHGKGGCSIDRAEKIAKAVGMAIEDLLAGRLAVTK